MINFTNSLSGNCNFVYLKKFKEEVECFLQNQKIDNSNDAVEDFFLLSFSNKINSEQNNFENSLISQGFSTSPI